METSPEQTPDYLMIDGNGLVKDLNSRLGIPANAQLFNKLFLTCCLQLCNYNKPSILNQRTGCLLKPLQNKKGQKIWGTREKSSPFIRKKTAFFSGTPNFFGPSYFEAALV